MSSYDLSNPYEQAVPISPVVITPPPIQIGSSPTIPITSTPVTGEQYPGYLPNAQSPTRVGGSSYGQLTASLAQQAREAEAAVRQQLAYLDQYQGMLARQISTANKTLWDQLVKDSQNIGTPIGDIAYVPQGFDPYITDSIPTFDLAPNLPPQFKDTTPPAPGAGNIPSVNMHFLFLAWLASRTVIKEERLWGS